jgi:hypothetical protein
MRRKTVRTSEKIAAGLVMMALLSACGGSSSHKQAGSAAGVGTTAAVATPSQTLGRRSGGDETGAAVRAHDPVSRRNRSSRARLPRADSPAEAQSASATAADPCRLVTRSEARSIVGAAVSKPRLGLQGPTCIYRTRRGRQPITVAVQAVPVAALARLSGGKVIHTTVAKRKALCVNYGGTKLIVPLSGGSVLTIGAPCPIGAHLAATALRRLR